VAARLVEALAASGNTSGALQAARVHEALVRSELGSEPDAGFVAAVASVRERLDRAAVLTHPVSVAPVSSTPRDAREPATPAAAGDTAMLAQLIEPMREIGERSGYGRDRRLHHYARGLLLKARGRREEAVAEFRAAMFSPNLGYTRVNLELGRLYLDLGRPYDAIAVLSPALRGSLEASNLYVTHTEVHALLARAFAATGASDSAAVHDAYVARALAHSDPGVRARFALRVARP
jgi:predicted Zn-dependent protease